MSLDLNLAVNYANESLKAKAFELAEQLNLPVNPESKNCLFLAEDKLSLNLENFSPSWVDFSEQTWKKRRAEGKKQGLVRACKPKAGMKIIDLTAGWGRDAAILASFGAEVLMLERQPVMAALLKDALNRRDLNNPSSLQLSLVAVDAREYLQNLTPENYPDVIYLDPMHPVRQKSALVKKEMQILQELIGADNDAKELLQLACNRVKKRLVVKWPQKQPAMVTPSASIEGKTIRFDIYLPTDPREI